MHRIAIATALALGLMAQAAAAQSAPPPPVPKPPDPAPGDGNKATAGFSLQPIAPLRDGNNYWPGYLLLLSTSTGGIVEACYIIARSADLGGGTLAGTLKPDEQVKLLCADSITVGKPDATGH